MTAETTGEISWDRVAEARLAVFHAPTGVVGRVLRVTAPGEHVSPVNGEPVAERVAVLDTGDSFVASERTLRVLNDAEVAFHEGFQGGLAELVLGAAQVGAGSGLEPEAVVALLTSALRAQAAALGRAPAA